MQKSKEEENSQSMEVKEEETLDLSNSSLAQAISKDSSEQNTKEEAQNEEVKVSTEKEETNEKEEAPKE